MILMKRQHTFKVLKQTFTKIQTGKRCASAFCKEDGDFSAPCIQTEVPGPISKKELMDLSQLQSVSNLHFVVDYEKSKGNYVADVDGNVYLDINQQNASLPLGYNHTAVLKAVQSKEHLTYLMNKPPLTSVLSGYQGKKLKELLLKNAPTGLYSVHASECGACSIHNATKAAFVQYMAHLKGDIAPDSSDLLAFIQQECTGATNRSKGCLEILSREQPNLQILSFVSPSHDKQGFKVSSRGELRIAYPDCRHSTGDFAGHDMDEEGKCLEKVYLTFKEYLEKGKHIAAVLVEPVQNVGNRHASPYFFQSLQAISREFHSAFIVDESFTGLGATGSFWAHEEWNLPAKPDIVILPRKMPIGGFYFNEDLMPSSVSQAMNAWIGDSSKLLVLQAIFKEIDGQDLLTRTRTSGDALRTGLLELQEAYPDSIKSIRGKGTFCSLELEESLVTGNFGHYLRTAGVEHMMNENYLSIRPPLIFTTKHAGLLCELIGVALRKCRHGR